MSRQIIPQQETDHNADFARWQFEVARAEWEAEQPEEIEDHRCCERPLLTLSSILAYRHYKLRTVRTVACRRCRQVVAGEMD